MQREFGSFAAFAWLCRRQAIVNARKTLRDVPARTEESDPPKEPEASGFKFVGSTIMCAAFMQAVGMVNDHQVDCFRYAATKRLAKARYEVSDSLLQAVAEVAALAGAEALKHFGVAIDVELKVDGSPVTQADRNAERAARAWIEGALSRRWHPG